MAAVFLTVYLIWFILIFFAYTNGAIATLTQFIGHALASHRNVFICLFSVEKKIKIASRVRCLEPRLMPAAFGRICYKQSLLFTSSSKIMNSR